MSLRSRSIALTLSMVLAALTTLAACGQTTGPDRVLRFLPDDPATLPQPAALDPVRRVDGGCDAHELLPHPVKPRHENDGVSLPDMDAPADMGD